jgi:hypothetical protein
MTFGLRTGSPHFTYGIIHTTARRHEMRHDGRRTPLATDVAGSEDLLLIESIFWIENSSSDGNTKSLLLT